MIAASSKCIGKSTCSSSTYSALQAVFSRYSGNNWFLAGERRYRTYSNGSNSNQGSTSRGGARGMNIFDRKAKRWHKNRAAMAPDADTFDYLRDEVCWL